MNVARGQVGLAMALLRSE